MAGHSKFKTIKHRKGAQDARRSNTFTKLIREIIVATKAGDRNPDFNPRLRVAINAARSENMPKDKIEGAINKASSNEIGSNYEEIRYEGYGPAGTALIVEGLIENRHKTSAEIRKIFEKNGGHIAETGSVTYMFKKIGFMLYSKEVIKSADEFLNAVLESGADDCVEHEDCYEVVCQLEDFHVVKDHLESHYGEAAEAKIEWRANNIINLEGEDAVKANKLLDLLHDNDDVQSIACNFETA